MVFSNRIIGGGGGAGLAGIEFWLASGGLPQNQAGAVLVHCWAAGRVLKGWQLRLEEELALQFEG